MDWIGRSGSCRCLQLHTMTCTSEGTEDGGARPLWQEGLELITKNVFYKDASTARTSSSRGSGSTSCSDTMENEDSNDADEGGGGGDAAYDSGGELGNCSCKERASHSARAICNDDSCLNYAMRIECPPGYCGSRCRNQRLQRGEHVPVEVFDAGRKGWGLRLAPGASARKGQLLCEYVGEILPRHEMDQRMSKSGLGLSKLYMMSLGKGLYLDARYRGGVARFINHSCEPSCIMEHWTVAGKTRCAVIALQDLSEGGELTFDYQWETRPGRVRTKCLCGMLSCRGFVEVDDLDADQAQDCFRAPSQEVLDAPGQSLVGKRVSVFWSDDLLYYSGRVLSFDQQSGMHLVAYDRDGEEHEENLGSQPRQGNDVPWKIWDESLEGKRCIKKKDRAPPLPDPLTMDDEEESEAPATASLSRKSDVVAAAAAPILLRRRVSSDLSMLSQKRFIVTLEHAHKLLQFRSHLLLSVEARSSTHVAIAKEADPRAAHIGGGRMLTIHGKLSEIKHAASLMSESGINLHPEAHFVGIELPPQALDPSSAASASADMSADPAPPPHPQRPRTQRCLGWDWSCIDKTAARDCWRDAEQVRRIALPTISEVGEKSHLEPSAVLHAATLVQRFVLLSTLSQKRDISPFVLATACLRLASRSLRVRVPGARPPKTSALLREAYKVQFPGREFIAGTPEVDQWERRVGLCEAAVLTSQHFDFSMEDPLLCIKRIAAQLSLSEELRESSCILAIDIAIQGLCTWLLHCRPVVVTSVILLAHIMESAGKHTCSTASIEQSICAKLQASISDHGVWSECLDCAHTLARDLPRLEGASTLLMAAFSELATRTESNRTCRHEDPRCIRMPRALEAASQCRLLSTSDFSSALSVLRLGGGVSVGSAARDADELGPELGAPFLMRSVISSPRKSSLDVDRKSPSKVPSSKLFCVDVAEDRLTEVGLMPLISGFPVVQSSLVVTPSAPSTVQLRKVCLQKCSGLGDEAGMLSSAALCEIAILQRLHSRADRAEGCRHIIQPLAVVSGCRGVTSLDELQKSSFLLLEPVAMTLMDIIRVWRHPHPGLPASMVESFVADILRAVKHCHDHGVIVRHLDPGMVFVSADGSVKLGGLGSSSLVEDPRRSWKSLFKDWKVQEKLKRSGEAKEAAAGNKRKRGKQGIAGQEKEPCSRTLPTLAPELLLCSQAFSVASDAWSVACLGSQLSLGKPLFTGRDRKDQVSLLPFLLQSQWIGGLTSGLVMLLFLLHSAAPHLQHLWYAIERIVPVGTRFSALPRASTSPNQLRWGGRFPEVQTEAGQGPL
jgi:serine/threonine protein kinase